MVIFLTTMNDVNNVKHSGIIFKTSTDQKNLENVMIFHRVYLQASYTYTYAGPFVISKLRLLKTRCFF